MHGEIIWVEIFNMWIYIQYAKQKPADVTRLYKCKGRKHKLKIKIWKKKCEENWSGTKLIGERILNIHEKKEMVRKWHV